MDKQMHGALADMRPSWTERAACKGITREKRDEIFYRPDEEVTKQAHEYCDTCPVFNECLNHALRNETRGGQSLGIWANTSTKDRLRMRRNRRAS